MNEIDLLLQEANDICTKLGAKDYNQCIQILEKKEKLEVDKTWKRTRARIIG